MHISLNWLKDFVDIKTKPQELGDLLTLKTAEVESVQDQSQAFDNMVVGQITSITKHPNADKLKICKVSIGKETLQIVCGGANIKEDMYVAVAKIGAQVKWHGEGDLVTMERAKIRGEESAGMICAGVEIGIEDPNAGDHDILDLSSIKPKPGTPLSEIFQQNDTILEFDNKSLTHRPDLWGHYGIAREIAAITDTKLKPLRPEPKIPSKGESPKVEIENFKLCPRYCGLIINNIKVEESPDWLKTRLKAVGHGTHNNIVDVTNYIVAELGQPMHAFDKSYIKGGIIVRPAKDKEKITTLDDKSRQLTTKDLVIADHEKAVALAGVMGGENSLISNKTTSIILESATFDAGTIRRTSTKLGLRTDAVQRFEKSLDPNLAELAIKRAAELILQICPGAEIAGPITDIQKFDKTPLKITLDTEKTASKIGVDLSQKDIEKILNKLEFETRVKDKKTLMVTVPSFRATKDVTMEDDLIEEVARMYGYDNIAPTLPKLPTKLPLENTERFKKHRLRELLSLGFGFTEVYNYSFYGEKKLGNCLMSEAAHVKLLNYLSEDQTHMRTSMTPNLLKNLQEIVKYQDEAAIYEIGHTYKEIGQFYPLEEKKAVGAIIKKGKTDEVFYEAKGIVEAIFQKFSTPKMDTARGIDGTPYAHPNKAISYLDPQAQTIAKVFMLHPIVAKNHDLEKYSVAIFAINFTELLKLEVQERSYKSIPKFPNIEFDISVLVQEDLEAGTAQEAIHKANKQLISNINLFDIYRGESLEKGTKAFAFKITLQAPDRTLTDEEMTQTQQKIFKNLEAIGGTIRGK